MLTRGAPPLTVLTGPAGAGRTYALRELAGDLVAAGRSVHSLRFTPDRVLVPGRLSSSRTGTEDAGPSTILAPGPRRGAHTDPQVARRAGAAATAQLRGDGVLLVDDAQWADRDAVAVLEALVPRLRGTDARCVVTVRTPGLEPVRTDGLATIARLRELGLVTVRRMPLMRRDGVDRALRTALDAVPAADLVDGVLSVSRGVPVAVHDVVNAVIERDVVRIVDRHAYLVRPGPGGTADDQRHLLGSLRRLGADAWVTATATAFLHPLGAAAPALIAEALGTSVDRTRERLTTLHAAGFLHRGRRGESWRFLVPSVAAALRTAAGPFECRRLSALAVNAVWDGRAHCDDADFLNERILEAGSLVAAGPARRALLAQAARVAHASPLDASRWWRAASEVARDRPEWAMTRLTESAARFLGGDYDGCLRLVRGLFDEAGDQLPAEAAQEALVMLVYALHNTGDVTALEAIADGSGLMAQDDAAEALCRAIALGLLDRWSDALHLLDDTRDAWKGTSLTLDLGQALEAVADLYLGRPERFEARLAGGGPATRVSGEPRRDARKEVTTLLAHEDLRRSEAVLATEGIPEDTLSLTDRASLQMLRGDPGPSGDVLELARRALATGSVLGHDLGRVAMTRMAVAILWGRGHITVAGDLLTSAHAERPSLAHLLDDPGIPTAMALRDKERGRELAAASLRAATDRGIVAGLEMKRTRLGGLAFLLGDHAGAAEQLRALEDLGRKVPTDRTAMMVAFLRALVHRDGDAGWEAVTIGRARGVQFDLAIAQLQLVGSGIIDPTEILEAYAIFGRFAALLYRALARHQMARHHVTVPGRQTTVVENERLLATLVAEGFSNRQIATAIGASEKSVEGRLGRLFAHSGYQSRIELAGAIQRGELGT
ncbi:AAA family ATPase [Actinomycetospora sp. OC33-EN08]|uniref:AAA family ATPase n=1 Tax=Actinomycetospora aurantiaca TaxID=3129233 RepID=A0ABU8MT79_9PSEU